MGGSLFWNGAELGSVSSAGGWTNLSGNIYTTNLTDKVGIGLNSPISDLHVLGNDGLIVQGSIATGRIQNLGGGARVHFYPYKASFRAGYANGSSWDHSNTGDYSVAMGLGTIASGFASTALGEDTRAEGLASTALGQESIASGYASTSMGYSSDASGDRSMAIGYDTKAESFRSIALGSKNIGGGTADTWIGTDPLLEIGNGETERSNALTILKNGKVGIGTVEPNVKLSLGSDITTKKLALFDGINNFYGFGVDWGRITFLTNDTEKMTITDLGNVGIGTSTPGANLEVNGSVKIGASGVKFFEIIELNGETGTGGTDRKTVSYPTGYNKVNTRVLSYEVREILADKWVSGDDGLWYALGDNDITVGYGTLYTGSYFRLILMKVEQLM